MPKLRPRTSGGLKRPKGNASDIGAFEVGGLNTRPAASNQTLGTSSDTTVAIKLVATDVDTADTLSLVITSLPGSGALYAELTKIISAPQALAGDTVMYKPHTGSSGSDNFKFKANDGTVDSNVATVTIFVIGQANAVLLAFDATVAPPRTRLCPSKWGGADADGDTLSFTIASLPTTGDLLEGSTKIIAVPHGLAGSGDTVTYKPHTGSTGSYSFQFKVNDGTADSRPRHRYDQRGGALRASHRDGQSRLDLDRVDMRSRWRRCADCCRPWRHRAHLRVERHFRHL